MQPAKNILTVFLLAAFSLPLMLPVFLQVQQLCVQWEMLEKLEKEAAVTIQVKAAGVRWIKQNKECLIGDEMFDVKQIEKQKDELILTGLFDEKEKAIKQQLHDMAGRENQPASKHKIKPFSFVFYFCETATASFSLLQIKKTNSLYKQSFYTSPFNGYNTPPPRTV